MKINRLNLTDNNVQMMEMYYDKVETKKLKKTTEIIFIKKARKSFFLWRYAGCYDMLMK